MKLSLTCCLVALCLALVLPVSADIFADATAGNVAAVQQALDAGADVNGVDATGATLLQCAVAADKADVVKLLVERKANLEARNSDGATALHVAVLSKSGASAPLLVAAGAHLDAVDKLGKTPLALLKFETAHADRRLVPVFESLVGPIFVAATKGDLAMAQAYFAQGGSANVMAGDLWFANGIGASAHRWSVVVTPLHVAVASCRANVAQLLLSKGAKPNSRMLEAAAEGKQTALVSLLLAKGVAVTGTALCRGTASGDVALAKLLLAKVTAAQVKRDMEWLWIGTNKCGSVEMAKLIVSKGASVNFHDALGYTPLHEAASAGNLAMVKFLISKGAKVNERTKCPGHPTPLALAKKAKRPNAELIKYLRAHGAK